MKLEGIQFVCKVYFSFPLNGYVYFKNKELRASTTTIQKVGLIALTLLYTLSWCTVVVPISFAAVWCCSKTYAIIQRIRRGKHKNSPTHSFNSCLAQLQNLCSYPRNTTTPHASFTVLALLLYALSWTAIAIPISFAAIWCCSKTCAFIQGIRKRERENRPTLDFDRKDWMRKP
jgi:hypothetical protein